MPQDLRPGGDEIDAPPLTMWQRAWRWLEGHTPDLTAVFDDDDAYVEYLRRIASPAVVDALVELVDAQPEHLRPAAGEAVVELVKVGFAVGLIRDAALAATLAMTGPRVELVPDATSRLAGIVHRLNLNADQVAALPAIFRLHEPGRWW